MKKPARPAMTEVQKKVIKLWLKTKVVHPSYREIAKAVPCSSQTAFKTVLKYKQEHKIK